MSRGHHRGSNDLEPVLRSGTHEDLDVRRRLLRQAIRLRRPPCIHEELLAAARCQQPQETGVGRALDQGCMGHPARQEDE
jgi:hypothetical protein